MRFDLVARGDRDLPRKQQSWLKRSVRARAWMEEPIAEVAQAVDMLACAAPSRSSVNHPADRWLKRIDGEIMKEPRAERVEALIKRLSAKGRWARASRIYGHWIDVLRDGSGAMSLPVVVKMWKYADLLRRAGDESRAAEIYREVALVKSKDQSLTNLSILTSLDRWALCLEAMALHKSARETRELAQRLRSRQIAEAGGESRNLSPSQLLVPTVVRCSFIASLEWEYEDDNFCTFSEGEVLTLRDSFKFSEPGSTWLEFEAKAPEGADPAFSHTSACVRFPWKFSGQIASAAALALVNEMNIANPGCSACLERDSGTIAVRALIGYAGYSSVGGSLGDYSAVHSEATLNMFLQVIGAAGTWEERIAELDHRLRTWNQAE